MPDFNKKLFRNRQFFEYFTYWMSQAEADSDDEQVDNELHEFYTLFMDWMVGMRMNNDGQNFFQQAVRELGYEPYELKPLLEERYHFGTTFNDFKAKMRPEAGEEMTDALLEAWTLFAMFDPEHKEFKIPRDMALDILFGDDKKAPHGYQRNAWIPEAEAKAMKSSGQNLRDSFRVEKRDPNLPEPPEPDKGKNLKKSEEAENLRRLLREMCLQSNEG